MTKPRPYGQYFLLEKIAQGGMAEIFKGLTYDFAGLKKFIVIKRILPHISANEDFIKMLVDEAKIAVRLSHGNIAQTYDLGKVSTDYFIVMEYVEGVTISQLLKKLFQQNRKIPIPLVAYVVSEICNGLDYIHRRRDEFGNALRIVHCDISPQNIIISNSGTVKIVDFGVAKSAFKLSEREEGVLKGKFAYMSPEQIKGNVVEATSDIFSTGVVLWEMLTGRRLFKKKVKSDTIEAVQSMLVYPPSAFRAEVEEQLDNIVMKALERDPAKRFASAADISLELTKFILTHYPDFKPNQVADFIRESYKEGDVVSDFSSEKTLHEEVTVMEAGFGFEDEDTFTPGDSTMIINPRELDFHSLFEEMAWEDESEVTGSLYSQAWNEEEETRKHSLNLMNDLENSWLKQYKSIKSLLQELGLTSERLPWIIGLFVLGILFAYVLLL